MDAQLERTGEESKEVRAGINDWNARVCRFGCLKYE